MVFLMILVAKKTVVPWGQPGTAATKDSSGSRAQAEPTTICKQFSSQDLFWLTGQARKTVSFPTLGKLVENKMRKIIS